ncbi:MAG: response regulator [Gemmatimonadota bacterium]|nr:response regulator [Gemmatimonadota bacterium]
MNAVRILVIDDEPQIRRVVRHALEAEADRVLEAATGREGIDTAAAERPDLIVLDLGLPDMPGADVCRDIGGWSSVPIFVLSARHSDLEKAALLDSGADDYMKKCAHDHCCSRACLLFYLLNLTGLTGLLSPQLFPRVFDAADTSTTARCGLTGPANR